MAAAKGNAQNPVPHQAAAASPAHRFDTQETVSCRGLLAAVGAVFLPTSASGAATLPAPATPATTSTTLTAAGQAPVLAEAAVTKAAILAYALLCSRQANRFRYHNCKYKK
jgi:hypothetical protein